MPARRYVQSTEDKDPKSQNEPEQCADFKTCPPPGSHVRSHNRIIRRSQKEGVDVTEVSISTWMDTQTMAYTNNGIQVSLKKNILTHATTWMNLEAVALSKTDRGRQLL